ncbi:uncharacterized protein STEHIDRAFT_126450 [Stereum hirsutum FP-91666 SS1]|uniref:Uncharacterized protein n=1 Tax=Stereum hirsutum (strain FP-91666) TaxID=721885 RepID=R7RXJ4_STEHR|nr:uncharacterized protein STEHIDRAFT_126450 [Stereum hirsutum FP-91666 SS1]EIM79600.1 hypothetical protein STEHIDRAFT_126450 [Stereum hirsutum FP-91666 SS1]
MNGSTMYITWSHRRSQPPAGGFHQPRHWRRVPPDYPISYLTSLSPYVNTRVGREGLRKDEGRSRRRGLSFVSKSQPQPPLASLLHALNQIQGIDRCCS